MLHSKIHGKNRTYCVYIMYLADEPDVEYIKIRVEDENDISCFAEFTMPGQYCSRSHGFSEQEIMKLAKYLLNHTGTIWDMAREDNEGKISANA